MANRSSGDEQLKKLETEIEQVKEAIASLTTLDNTTTTSDMEHIRMVAAKQQRLGNMIEQREVMLEKRRVAEVIRRFQEEHPREEDECPLCSEPVPSHLENGVARFYCCCNFMCWTCSERVSRSVCPFCRMVAPSSEEEGEKMILRRATQGDSWAQNEMARRLLERAEHAGAQRSKRKYEEKAVKWLRRAVAQANPAAEWRLGTLYKYHENSVLPQSNAKALHFFQLAANHGYPNAQGDLGTMYSRGDGVEQDNVKAVYWLTLAASASYDSTQFACRGSQFALGCMFGTGKEGLEKNLELSKYYFEQAAAHEMFHGLAQYRLADVICALGEKRYGSIRIPGHSCIPRCMSLKRKALLSGLLTEEEVGAIRRFEDDIKSHCANCRKSREYCGGKLATCSRCHAACYCGRECQAQHWKDGHKKDCCST